MVRVRSSIQLAPTSKERFIWRARLAESSRVLEEILKNPHSQLSAPPPESAKARRMNAEGIAVFYGSFDESTCVAEARPPVGSQVVVGRFELLRSVVLLDLNALSRVFNEGSVFDPDYAEKVNRVVFLRSLVDEISRPVMPQDEPSEYLVTQVVAEYLANKATPHVDGIIFTSSQTGGDGRNLVLFHHATAVEPSGLPEGSYVTVHAFADPDFEDSTTQYRVSEMLPHDKTSVPEPPATEGDIYIRLDLDSIAVFTIQAVNYDKERHILTRHRRTEPDGFPLSRE